MIIALATPRVASSVEECLEKIRLSLSEAAAQGADIVCVPTNWVPIPGQAEGREAMANILAMAAAHSNSIYIACADRVGTERGQPFEGRDALQGLFR